MHFSSILALVVSLILVGITRGQKRNQNGDARSGQFGQYTQTADDSGRHQRRLQKQLERQRERVRSWTRARETAEETRRTVQPRQYMRPVEYRRKLQQRLERQMRRYPWIKTPKKEEKCEDRLETWRCKRYKDRFHFGGTCLNSPGTTIKEKRTNTIRRRLRNRCAKTCNLCQKTGQTVPERFLTKPQTTQKPTEPIQPEWIVNRTRLHRRHRKQPFPQVTDEGNRNTPRRGVYYIFTRRIHL